MTTNSGQRRRFTWRPDRRDSRDFIYARAADAAIPRAVDLHAKLPAAAAPYDQKSLGSCTGNGTARVAAFAHWKATGEWLNLSRLMIYYLERSLEGTVNEDSGAEIRDGVKALAKWGSCSETVWPYLVRRFRQKPSPAAYADALKRRIDSYHRITSLNDVKACIAEGFPVVFGFWVPASFEGDEIARTGVMRMPTSAKDRVGGHCMVWDAYDDDKAMLSGPNSWGTTWGDKGRFHMPYDYFMRRGLVSDMWTVRK
jgi:C1A family cysteine protease